jgi:hypothetical protein
MTWGRVGREGSLPGKTRCGNYSGDRFPGSRKMLQLWILIGRRKLEFHTRPQVVPQGLPERIGIGGRITSEYAVIASATEFSFQALPRTPDHLTILNE